MKPHELFTEQTPQYYRQKKLFNLLGRVRNENSKYQMLLSVKRVVLIALLSRHIAIEQAIPI